MGHSRLYFLALLSLALIAPIQLGNAATVIPVDRVFYLTPSKTLTASNSTITSGIPTSANLTTAPIKFGLPAPIQPPPGATMSGAMRFHIWLSANRTTTVVIEGTFREFLGIQPQGGEINATSTDTHVISLTATTEYKLTFDLSSRPLVLGAQIAVSLRLVSSMPNSLVTMYWGSTSTPSFVILPLSGSVALDTARPVIFLDSQQQQNNRFDLNSTDRLVIFEAFVNSMLGFDDIGRVNLTLVDPNGHLVKDKTNLDMTPLGNPGPPYSYTWTWNYPSGATEGPYQVWIDIFDRQGNRAFTFRGPLTFTLFRPPTLLQQSLNLLPYFAVAGVGVAGSVTYYRRRKKKSYLAPFDYFNTLTAGELEGGSVVAVEGNTGSGKTLLSEQLMFEDLKKGRPCVFVATGDFPSNIRANMKAMGLDVTGYEQNGLLTFVDGYSAEAGQQSPEKFAVPSLSDLTTLGIKISSSLSAESFKDGSLYFDSLTPLASKTKPDSIVSLVQSVGARVKGVRGKAFFTVGPSVEGMVQRRVEEIADAVVQMEAFEEGGMRKSRLKIAKLRARKYQQGWTDYTVEEGKGIIFYSKKPRS